MLRRLTLACALLTVFAAVALAAPIAGKVQSTAGDTLVVKFKAEQTDWLKKGTNVKILGGKGLIIAVQDSLVTITSPKAKEAKAGQDVTFEKAKAAMTGC